MKIEIYLALEEAYNQKIKEATSQIEKLLEDPNLIEGFENLLAEFEKLVEEISKYESELKTLKKIFGE